MLLDPTSFDVWLVARLAWHLGRHPDFDIFVQQAIRHNLLGGFWFAGALFVYWLQGSRSGQEKTQCRMLTTLIGTAITITLALLAGLVFWWPPPSRYPGLAHFYPDYLDQSLNISSFPSRSTALYMAVTAGIYTKNKLVGSVLGAMVLLFVALPRVYVGGHYPTDILVGIALGIGGTLTVIRFLEPRLAPYVLKITNSGRRWRVLLDIIVYVCILQIADEFKGALWLKGLIFK